MKTEQGLRNWTEPISNFFERISGKRRKDGLKQLEPFFAGLHEAHELVRETGDRSAALDFFHHQLKTLVEEHIGLPFHSTAYQIDISTLSNGKLDFTDPIYKDSSVIERSVRGAVWATEQVRQKRYLKEADQVIRLAEAVYTLLETGTSPQSLIDLIGDSQTDPTDQATKQAVKQALFDEGWVAAPTQPPRISADASRVLGVPQTAECIVGPQFLYIMPQSKIHWNMRDSMYVIAQPAYLPATDEWVLLHDQQQVQHSTLERLFPNLSWKEHHRVLQAVEPTHTKLHTLSFETQEQYVMSKLYELPTNSRARHPQDIFLDLMKDDKKRQTLVDKQQQLAASTAELEKTLVLHANYLLDILDFEVAANPTVLNQPWSEELKKRLAVVLRQSLSTLLHKEELTPELTKQWFELYQEAFNTPEKRAHPDLVSSQLLAASAANAPWLLYRIVSPVECVGLMFPSMAIQHAMNPTIFTAMQSNSLSWAQAYSLWGKDAHMGRCVACIQDALKKGVPKAEVENVVKETLLGGCNICGAHQAQAELAEAALANTLKNGAGQTAKPTGAPKPEFQNTSMKTEPNIFPSFYSQSLTQFLATF